MKQFLIFLSLFNFFIPKNNAQSTFKGGLTLGMNMSQLNGDNSAGFNKFGFIGGAQVSVDIGEKNYISTAILYSERGSKPRRSEVFNTWTIALPYVEVPLLIGVKDWKIEDKNFYKMHAGVGFLYGRLFNPKATTLSGWEGKENYFRKNNLAWVAEATLFQTRHIGYSFRYTRDIIRVFQKSDDLPTNPPLIGHLLTLKGVYIF
jgi:Outer membrane protein beta-barrel domain